MSSDPEPEREDVDGEEGGTAARDSVADSSGGCDPAGIEERPRLEVARGLLLGRLHLGIAHDLRAPLNATRLCLASLRTVLADALPPGEGTRHLATLQLVEQELGRLHRGLESLLELVRPPAAQPEDVELGEIVRAAEPLLEALARQRRVGLHIELPGEPMVVRTSREWLLVALLGLVVDALEVAPERSTVTVRGGRSDREVIVAVEGAPRVTADASGREGDGPPAETLVNGAGVGGRVLLVAASQAGGSTREAPGEGAVMVRELRLPRAIPPAGGA